MTTLFTKIIAGQIPGRFVWADDVAVAFGTIAPITDGHMLVVPRDEVVQLTEASDDLLAHLMVVARTLGQAQQAAWSAPARRCSSPGSRSPTCTCTCCRRGTRRAVVPQRPHRRPRRRARRRGVPGSRHLVARGTARTSRRR